MGLFGSLLDLTGNVTYIVVDTIKLPVSLTKELLDEESNAMEDNLDELSNDFDKLCDNFL